MTTIASLAVRLMADTDQFRSAMGGVDRQLGNLKRTIAGVAGSFSIGLLVKNTLDAAEQLDIMSRRTGATVELLSALRHIAERTGTEFDEIVDAISDMQEKIGEAGEGTDAQRQIIEQLGISVDDLKQLTTDQQFLQVGLRIAGIADAAQQAAVGNEIFGGAWRRLKPIFEQGEAGLRRMLEEARKLNKVMGKDTVDAAVQAKRQLQDFQDTISSAAANFVLEYTEELSGLIDFMTRDFLPRLFDLLKRASQGLGMLFGGAASFVGAKVGSIGSGTADLSFGGVRNQLGNDLGFFRDLWSDVFQKFAGSNPAEEQREQTVEAKKQTEQLIINNRTLEKIAIGVRGGFIARAQ